MWSDNETTKDLLNYELHCNLLKEYLTNKELLPLTIGVFGDWGSGKSSIMRMLEEKFKSDEKILTIYFNGWLFEGYEDAKISLLENIILELSRHESLNEKVKSKILSLLSRIDYMKLASDGVKKYGKNIIDIFTTGGVITAIEAGYSMLSKDLTDAKLTPDLINQYIKDEQNNKTKTTIKSFRQDFAELIALTNFDSVVIFIDDLDRCMPERVIDTLEAIKLFLSVENTAFVIGADERILKHAISMHLQLHTFNNNSSYLETTEQIVTDYIEKLIQLPYRIPKLSPAEIESYNNLLFCSKNLTAEEFGKVYVNYLALKKEDFYSSYSIGHIKEIICLDTNVELSKLLTLSHNMSQMITNVLKGNPRQTKRFLNTFILRMKLAQVANLDIDDLVLIKLMLLEYFDTSLFRTLNELQSNNDGIVQELQMLESVFVDKEEGVAIEKFVEWQTPQVKNWIKIEPRIGSVDLRNYFWLARDKTESTLSNVHMVSPLIQKIYKGVIDTDKHLRSLALMDLKLAESSVKLDVFNLLKNEILHNPSKTGHLLRALFDFIEKIEDEHYAKETIEIFSNVNFAFIAKERNIIETLKYIESKFVSTSSSVQKILKSFSEKPTSALQKAALKAIKD